MKITGCLGLKASDLGFRVIIAAADRTAALQGAWLDAQGLFDASSQDYVNSLAALDQRWPDFQRQLHEQRWDPSKCIYRLGDKRIDMRWRQHGRKNR